MEGVKMGFKFEIPEAVQRELDERDARKKEEEKLGIIRIPLPWEKEQRGAPSAIMRSALFGVVKRGKRAYLENKELMSWGSTSIKYTGARLMQSDQDVWLACVEACKRQMRTNVIISQRELMKLAKRKGSNTQRLWSDLVRLRAATVEVIAEKGRYVGGLIDSAEKDEETGHIALSINPKMLALFGGNVTHIDAEQRAALGLDLSKWLQGYICSHASTWRKPHFIGLEKLQGLCGSTATTRKFRQQIKKAMDELQQADVVAGWNIENDILTLWRPSR